MPVPPDCVEPDPTIDYAPNSRGSMVICVLRVKDVMASLRCSRSLAYEVIREIRGEAVGLRLAFVLPSQLRDWVARHAAPAIPSREQLIFKEPKQSEESALRDAARHARGGIASLRLTQPRTKPRPGGR